MGIDTNGPKGRARMVPGAIDPGAKLTKECLLP